MKNFLKYIQKNLGGFTLIEMLISITILSIVTGMGILNLTSYKNRHSFQLDGTNVLEGMRSAQNKAILGEQGTAWGIRFTPNTGSGSDFYEIFSGTTYASSSVVTTQTLSRSSKFSNPPSGFTKTIIFAKTTGVPDAAHVVGIQTTTGSDASVISVSKSAALNQLPGKDLVGYWPLDEESGTSAYDASGKGSTGTLQSSPVWQSASSGLCKTGGCTSLNGSSQYIDIGDKSNLNLTSGGTISLWVKIPSVWLGSAYPSLAGKGSSAGWDTDGWALFAFSDNRIGIGMRNGTLTMSSSFTNSIKDQWTHIVGTWDGSLVKLYQDGVQKTSNTQTITPPQTSTSFIIGRGPASYYFGGLIDDVRVYNRALATSEIKTLYESY